MGINSEENNSQDNNNLNELIFEKDSLDNEKKEQINFEQLKDDEESSSLSQKNVRFYYGSQIYLLKCAKDELFSSIFKKFKEKSKTENLDLYFISGVEKLNPEMKFNLLNLSRIDVYTEGEMKGGITSLKFTDVSKQITEEHFFSEDAPSYRVVTKGINIYGICKVRKCVAYKKEVIHPLIKIKKFDLIKEREDLECPECGGNITPKTVGFHLCEYRVTGKKYYNDKIEPFEFEGKAVNKNSIQYYNPDKNGETTLIELIIEITKDL